MAYQRFENKAFKSGSPQLTIRGGRIFFSAEAGDILVNARMKCVDLFWDAAALKIGIRPVSKEAENSFKASIPKGKRGGAITAQSFLTYIHWRSKEPVTVPAEWNEQERMLEAILPKEHFPKSATGFFTRRTE